MKNIHRRRRLIVNPEVQFDVLMYVGLFVATLFLGQILACYLFISKIQQISGIGDFQTMSVSEFIARYKIVFLVYQLIPVLLGLVVGYWYFNRMTSKIVGPLYNIKRTMRRIAENDSLPAPIQLRSDDYFQDLAEDINAALKKTK
ncbi:hypothetical protein D3C87_241860 [compost metagenome]